MVPVLAVPLFVVSLVVTLASAAFFARRLDSVGVRLGLPEALLGLLTALAADAPEITSALVALAKRAPGASLGVLVGSNVFNLAAMIGLAAVVTGRVRLRRESLLLEGSVGVLTTAVATGLLAGFLSPLNAALLTVAILAPYVFLLLRGRPHRRVSASAPDRGRPRRTRSVSASTPRRREQAKKRIWMEALLIVPAVALIVAGSTVMVEAALSLADRWHASPVAVGVLVLAPLTSIPNAFTALRLGLAHRGAALVSETLNSNTINLTAGLVVPALFVTIAAVSREAKFELGWLFVMTFATLLMLARRRGMGRLGGLVLIGLYAAFVLIELIRL